MKKVFLIFVSSTLILLNNVSAQTKAVKEDILYKVNGEEMKGRVTKISEDKISFVYSGETLEYTLNKSDVLKIVHSSGRVEMMDAGASSAARKNDPVTMEGTPADHHNKIAILPFTYLLDNQAGAEEVGLKAQQDTYSFLSRHAAGYTIMDTRTTNAMLIKAGMTRDKMMGFTMKEICDVLGVEYIVEGTVTQTKGYQTSSGSDISNAKVKRDGDDNVKSVSGYNTSYGSAVQRYDVSVSLEIYMDNNASIYNQSHRAFLSNTDGSYSGPLEYLLKRCPIYKK